MKILLLSLILFVNGVASGAPIKSKTIQFFSGVSTLSPMQKKEIRSAIEDYKFRGRSMNVEVAVWGDDLTFGDPNSSSLGEFQVAEMRAKAIQTYLSEFKADLNKITVYNMTKNMDSEDADTATLQKRKELRRQGASNRSVIRFSPSEEP